MLTNGRLPLYEASCANRLHSTERTSLRAKIVWLVCACFTSLSGAALLPAQTTSTGPSPDWFAVKLAQQTGATLSVLCKGQLGIAEGLPAAEHELRTLIASSPQSGDAYAAHSTLLHFYLRVGRFRDANAEVIAMLKARPAASDLVDMHSLLALLAAYPDFAINDSHPATVRTEVFDGNVFAPVKVQGAERSYMLDNGMAISMMTESEAKSLGLTPHSSTLQMHDISGLSGPALQIVMVDRLIFGSTELRNIPFMVVEDTHGAFLGVPEGHHGILGIQPLVAAGTLEFHADGSLSLASRVRQASTSIPMLYAGEGVLTQILYRDRPLTVTLDTGATQTTINPPFTALYPDVLSEGKNEDHVMNGVSGTSKQKSVSLPHLSLRFGRSVELSPATILLSQTTGTSAYAAANLGYDLLQKARPITLDFTHMVIRFPRAQ